MAVTVPVPSSTTKLRFKVSTSTTIPWERQVAAWENVVLVTCMSSWLFGDLPATVVRGYVWQGARGTVNF